MTAFPARNEHPNNVRQLPDQRQTAPRNPLFDVNPPASVEAEKALLGSVLIYPGLFRPIASFLRAEDFFFIRHSHIWSAMEWLVSGTFVTQDPAIQEEYAHALAGIPIDPVLLAEALTVRKQLEAVGGRAYIAELTNSTPTSVHGEFYAQLVERAAVRREYLRAADDAKTFAADEELDLEAVVTKIEEQFSRITLRATRGGLEQIGGAVDRELRRLDGVIDAEKKPVYSIPMPYAALNRLAGDGWWIGRMHVIASYAHGGKTTIMMQSAIHAAKSGLVTAFFSVEGTTEEVTRDIVSMHAGVRSVDVLNGRLTNAEYGRYLDAAAEITNWPLFIDGDKDLDPRTMYNRIKLLQATVDNAPMVVFVDYLGKLQLPADKKALEYNKTLKTSYLSDAMKKTAVNLRVALVVAHQNSRPDKPATKGRGKRRQEEQSRRPQLSDLSDSADVDRDADFVLMPWFIDKVRGDAELCVVKNKLNGWNGGVQVRWDKLRAFRDWTTPQPTATSESIGQDTPSPDEPEEVAEHWSDGK